MTHLNFLAKFKATVPLWELWRDMTWARKDKAEWLAKMERIRAKNPGFAYQRALYLVTGRALDWDDNIPVSWGREFLER